MALLVKNPPADAGDTESQVQSLGQEDPLEEDMATHSSKAHPCRIEQNKGQLLFIGTLITLHLCTS